jgi:hypothetical protein
VPHSRSLYRRGVFRGTLALMNSLVATSGATLSSEEGAGALGSPLAGDPLVTAFAEARRTQPRRTTFSLGLEVAEAARDAAYFERVTVVELVETAILHYVQELEDRRGEPFAKRPRRERPKRTCA